MIFLESDGISIIGTIATTGNNLVKLPPHRQYSAVRLGTPLGGAQHSVETECFKETYLMSSIELFEAGQKFRMVTRSRKDA